MKTKKLSLEEQVEIIQRVVYNNTNMEELRGERIVYVKEEFKHKSEEK